MHQFDRLRPPLTPPGRHRREARLGDPIVGDRSQPSRQVTSMLRCAATRCSPTGIGSRFRRPSARNHRSGGRLLGHGVRSNRVAHPRAGSRVELRDPLGIERAAAWHPPAALPAGRRPDYFVDWDTANSRTAGTGTLICARKLPARQRPRTPVPTRTSASPS